MSESKSKRKIRIHAVGQGPGLRAVLLGCQAYELVYHWETGQHRSIPCSAPLPCPCCALGAGRRWKAYAAAMLPAGDLGVLEMTLRAVQAVASQADPVRGFRGAYISMVRSNRSPQGRVSASILGYTAPARLPPDFELEPFLSALYGHRLHGRYLSPAALQEIIFTDRPTTYNPGEVEQ